MSALEKEVAFLREELKRVTLERDVATDYAEKFAVICRYQTDYVISILTIQAASLAKPGKQSRAAIKKARSVE